MGVVTLLLIGMPGRAWAGTVFVHLFEWKWTDIAEECEQFLGPKGFEAVQISPPNEHIDHSPWWARYQPVSFLLESRSGTRAELIGMIQRCNAAGVEIYADLVINHTAVWSGGGIGVAGTPWFYKHHPIFPVYTPPNYHSDCAILDYRKVSQVWRCALLGLPDVATEQDYVQKQLAKYILTLRGVGVGGFRIDAAKHMPPQDIAEMLVMAGAPWAFSEVIEVPGEAIRASWYTTFGRVTEFSYARQIGYAFLYGRIADLRNIPRGKLPSDEAIVFVDNHDVQRGHGAGGEVLTYKDGSLYNLATVFMLAYPYGYPMVMSSYRFTNPDAGPPPGGGGCANRAFVCEHRWTSIANMVEFRNVTAGTELRNWWSNGNDRIAFSRGNRGFVAINNEGTPMVELLRTNLPAGLYCNVASGDPIPGSGCSGPTVLVDQNGLAALSIAPYEAVAIHVGARAVIAP